MLISPKKAELPPRLNTTAVGDAGDGGFVAVEPHTALDVFMAGI